MEGSEFRVVVTDPKPIFDLVWRGLLTDSDENPLMMLDISRTTLDDNLFWNETTGIGAFLVDGAHYSIDSKLYFAERELLDSPFGFYPYERISRVQQGLKSQGLRVDNLGIYDSEDTHLFIYHDDSLVGLEVNLGYQSREKMADHYRKRVEKYEDMPMIRRHVIRNAVRASENADFNESIGVELKEKSYLGGPVDLTDQSTFSIYLREYAQVYEKLIRALYEERGTTPPPVPIVFQELPDLEI